MVPVPDGSASRALLDGSVSAERERLVRLADRVADDRDHDLGGGRAGRDREAAGLRLVVGRGRGATVRGRVAEDRRCSGGFRERHREGQGLGAGVAFGDRHVDDGEAGTVVVSYCPEAEAVVPADRRVGRVRERDEHALVGFHERVPLDGDRHGLGGLTGSERHRARRGGVVARRDRRVVRGGPLHRDRRAPKPSTTQPEHSTSGSRSSPRRNRRAPGTITGGGRSSSRIVPMPRP